MGSILHDLRTSLRSLLKNPGFTIGVVLILALGIGANASVFSLVNAFLLRPLPFHEPERLVHIWQSNPLHKSDELRVSVPDFLDWKAQAESLEDLGGYYYSGFNVTSNEVPISVQVGLVTDNLIGLLGVEPIRGRSFMLDDGKPGQDQVVLLSENYWQRYFHGREDIVGQTVALDGETHIIIGVMPETFEFPLKGTRMWKPLVLEGREWDRDSAGPLLVVGRLKPDATLDQARAEMNTISSRLAEMYPEANKNVGANVVPLRQAMVFFYDMVRIMFLMLMLSVGFVMLIVCANVGNLLLARSMGRSRDMAIRVALGAGRGRIIRHLFSESLCLALAGGALGTLIAYGTMNIIGPLIPEGLYRAGAINLDARVLVFTLGVSLLVAVLFGLIPAIFASRTDINQALRSGGGGRGSTGSVKTQRLHGILVVSEISLAVVLVVSSILMVRSFSKLQDVDTGFDPAHVLTMEMDLPAKAYAGSQGQNNFYEELVRRTEVLPQVVSAATLYPLPLNFESYEQAFIPQGQPFRGPEDAKAAGKFWVSPNFFVTMEIPVLNGRTFTDQDHAEAEKVVIITESMATHYWAGENAIGQRVTLDPGKDDQEFATVVGVVKDIKAFLMNEDGEDLMFFSQLQFSTARRFLAVRTLGDPLGMVESVRVEIAAMDPALPVTTIRSMDRVVTESLGIWGGAAAGFGALGLVALVLATMGLYSLIAYSVGQRVRELGIRIALGAQGHDIISLVVRKGLNLTAIGLGLGIVGAYGLSRLLAVLLYDISPQDPLTFILTSVALFGAAMLACILPARKAMKVDPMTALRND